MERAIIVRGTLSDPTHIELEEPVSDLCGAVEVTLRPIEHGAEVPVFESTTLAAWEEAFHAWVATHERNFPIPTDESLRREGLYEDRR